MLHFPRGPITAGVAVLCLTACVSSVAVDVLPQRELSKPTSPQELLRNVKYAIDSQSILDKDFYTEANLKKVFGAEKVQWRVQNDPRKQWAHLSGFNSVIPSVTYNDIVLSGVSVSIDRTERENGTVSGRIDLSFQDDPRVSFDSIQKIFGTNWEYAPMSLSPHPPVQQSTSEWGNARIMYDKTNGGVRQTITMRFSSGANLSIANFSLEK